MIFSVVLATKRLMLGLILAAGLAACSPSSSNSHAVPSDSNGSSGDSAGLGTGPQPGDPTGNPFTSSSGRPTSGSTGRPPGVNASTSTGWTVTVYYTAVARFHTGRAVKVTGCPKLDCTKGNSDLGSYPSDFVQAVKDEGAGKIADGRYLNWSYDTGYWLDTAARDTAGRVLKAFESAAADSNVLHAGTPFTIVQCGLDDGGNAIDAGVCLKLRGGHWTITDEFTPGLGGARHVDVYVGEEAQPHFTDSALYTTLKSASLAIG
jgi:hypothetical protein